ncbi:acetoacetyl-CoA synthetase [Caerostris extrusa]|uniref:Acetoacetyl-CoA synthetase n=1 Tax=Caerostris extrusa TaxID=172846 RepID=A0AAV4Y9P5_CAEEX|nr:acetoacetyl-CoA synthetase [Caerostris extrusa]
MEAMYQKRFQEVQQVWEPKEHHGKNRKKLTKIIEDKYNVKLDTYEKLYRWSVDNLCEFWAEMWDFFGIISSKRFDKVLDMSVPMDQSPEWFVGARLNFAENLLKYRDDRIAVTVDGEESEIKTFTFAQMFEDARLLAAAFRKMGLKKGDVVACFMSNRKEALTAMHAATSTGAIWTASLPYLGPEVVIQRFKIVNPKILVAVDRFVAGGNEVEMLTKVKSIVKGLPTLEKVIIVETRPDSHLRDISDVKNCVFLKDFLKTGLEEDGSVPPMVFEQVAFSHPVTISYTSGTTGQPKPLVHGSGTLFATANTFGINYDCDRDASWLSVSAAGWASWNIFAVFPFLGNSVLLYDGDPYFLSPTHIWDLIDKHHITHAFFLARVVDELRKETMFQLRSMIFQV